MCNGVRKRLGCFRGGRGEKGGEGRNTKELKCCSRVALARGVGSEQNQSTEVPVGLFREIGQEEGTAAAWYFDGNGDNGGDAKTKLQGEGSGYRVRRPELARRLEG